MSKERDFERVVERKTREVKLAEAALAGFRGDRLKGETVEETEARAQEHWRSCKHCSSYESPDRYCATFSEHVRRCETGGRLMKETEDKGTWRNGKLGPKEDS